ncbi:4Fe-4S ferredoxin [Vallitalea pronyensis]|uniref:4Fe-4S ferredoxin n=1 Tax=Vallitalea pronyensis TaxID=1348613 RepID=A0A8J8MPU5_9FIRM|nr:4Fe-4S binding protein [Vallitalea pronyensis]QUI25163.1 4Fe-4S ferredoxin [Vallitalea pronyensis]
MKKNHRKSHMGWSYIIIITFFILGIIDLRFGILGTVCMGAPIYHALRGRGKVHCSKYCPRGSFLGKFLAKISLGHTLPKWLRTKKAKNIILAIMLTVFTSVLTYAIVSHGFHFSVIAKVFYRFMLSSFIVGVVIGVVFKPRSWCQICPMGHGSGLIKQAQDKKNKEQALKLKGVKTVCDASQ